jgi:hypothetical protein
MLFKEIITVYMLNHTEQRNTKCSVTDCRRYIHLPQGFKRLIKNPTMFQKLAQLLSSGDTIKLNLLGLLDEGNLIPWSLALFNGSKR